MHSSAQTADEYISEFSEAEQAVLTKLRKSIKDVLPEGFVEGMQYGMISYFVPLDKYPQGYLNDPAVPVSYIALAKQKNHYAFYSLASYGLKELFEKEKTRYEKTYGKLDHGVSCIRFRNEKKIDLELVKNITKAMSLDEFIAYYDRERGSK